MYITGLEASGLYGLSFQHELQRCVLFTGKNFSGKSVRQAAIRFALQGRVPDLDKTNQALWELSGGSAVRVGLTLDTGRKIARSLVKSGDSVRSDLIDEGETFGWMPMLDPDEYFNQMSDSDRVQAVFRLMQMPSTFTVDGIIAELRNLSLDENTEQTEKAKREVIGIVKDAFHNNRQNGLISIPRGLTELTRDKGPLKSAFSIANARAKDTQGTLRVLSELKTREGEASADNIASVAADLGRVVGELERANYVAGQLAQEQMEANRVSLRRRQIDTELRRVPEADTSSDILELSVKEVEKKLKKVKAPDQEELELLQDALTEAADAMDTAEANRTNIQAAVDTAAENLEKLENQTVCPHCKSKGKDWKKNLRAEYSHALAEHQAALATIQKQTKTLISKHSAALTAYRKAKTAYDARQALLNERAGYQTKLDAIKASHAGATARRQALQEELKSLGKVAAPTDAELSEAAAIVTRLKQEHATLTERHSALTKLQQDLIRAGEAAEEHRIAAAKVAVIKAVGAKLKEKQAAMIETLFGDLMKVANYFTRDIMEHELVFRDGKIGYVKHGHFVSHKTFSGTEESLTYIAITAALMKDAPLRLALLDEFDIDADVFPKVMDRLTEAVHVGMIDQVIVAHTFAPSELSLQWQHIPLQKAV